MPGGELFFLVDTLQFFSKTLQEELRIKIEAELKTILT
jgi:hypothetical protein